MFNDLHWSIYPGAEKDVLARVSAYAQHCINNGVSAGPALDAERDDLPIRMSGATAVIDVQGLMVRSAGSFARFFGMTGSDQIRQAIRAADADPDIEAIVMRVDSPGGSVSGVPELADAVASTQTPIFAHVEGMAASAAFWVASQADKITVGRMDLVGSIGARMLLFDFSQAFKKAGIEAVVIDTGEFKSTGAEGTVITANQRADLQRLIDFFFDGFVSQVAQGRGMSEKQVLALADGRMFTPDEALSNGLIDGISSMAEIMASFHGKQRQSTGGIRMNSFYANKPSAGTSLAGLLNDAIDSIDESESDDRSRADVIEEMGRAAGISASTVNQILNGAINCPPLDRLEGFARVRGIPSLQAQKSAAERDGCDYDTDSDSEGRSTQSARCRISL